MRKYEVIEAFHDRVLGRKVQKGDVYPPAGVTVDEAWIGKLSTKDNACGRPFIRAVEEQTPSDTGGEGGEGEAPAEETAQPAEEAEPPDNGAVDVPTEGTPKPATKRGKKSE